MQPWRKLSEQRIHDGYRTIDRRRFELPDRSEADFEVLISPDTVAVVALTLSKDVVLVAEYRPGPERVLLELPGGAVDAGETPSQAAVRELLEETGYEGTLRAAGSLWAGAYSSHRRHAFVATDCYRVAERWPEANEFIEVELVSLKDFRRHLRSGELTDAGLGYLGLEELGLLGD